MSIRKEARSTKSLAMSLRHSAPVSVLYMCMFVYIQCIYKCKDILLKYVCVRIEVLRSRCCV